MKNDNKTIQQIQQILEQLSLYGAITINITDIRDLPDVICDAINGVTQ
jgi:hypothetical protein